MSENALLVSGKCGGHSDLLGWAMVCRIARQSRRRFLPPHLTRYLDDQFELGLFLIDGERVALGVAGEAALRAQRQLLERHEFRRFVDAPLDVVLLLERSCLRRHQSEDDRLAFRDEPQRTE